MYLPQRYHSPKTEETLQGIKVQTWGSCQIFFFCTHLVDSSFELPVLGGEVWFSPSFSQSLHHSTACKTRAIRPIDPCPSQSTLSQVEVERQVEAGLFVVRQQHISHEQLNNILCLSVHANAPPLHPFPLPKEYCSPHSPCALSYSKNSPPPPPPPSTLLQYNNFQRWRPPSSPSSSSPRLSQVRKNCVFLKKIHEHFAWFCTIAALGIQCYHERLTAEEQTPTRTKMCAPRVTGCVKKRFGEELNRQKKRCSICGFKGHLFHAAFFFLQTVLSYQQKKFLFSQRGLLKRGRGYRRGGVCIIFRVLCRIEGRLGFAGALTLKHDAPWLYLGQKSHEQCERFLYWCSVHVFKLFFV